MEQTITGRVWVLGEDVDTDVIYPGKYLPILDAAEMGKHALEGLDQGFPAKMSPGDIIVAGPGFGCGSSREQAATCLKSAGVAAVIAGSFARIFFRNAVNQGLPLVQADVRSLLRDGDTVTIDFGAGLVMAGGKAVSFPALDPSVMDILAEGGLIPMVRKRMGLVA